MPHYVRNKGESHGFCVKIACKLAIKIETVSCPCNTCFWYARAGCKKYVTRLRLVTYFLQPALECMKNTYCMGKRPFLYIHYKFFFLSCCFLFCTLANKILLLLLLFDWNCHIATNTAIYSNEWHYDKFHILFPNVLSATNKQDIRKAAEVL